MMNPDQYFVFIVDDDPSMRRSLESLLRSVGLIPGCSDRHMTSYSPSGRKRQVVWCSMSDCRGAAVWNFSGN